MRRGFLLVWLIPALAACERENRLLDHHPGYAGKADVHVAVADRDKALRQRALMVQTDR